MTINIQAVEAGGRSGGRNFPAIEFAGKKSPDLAFSNVDRYVYREWDLCVLCTSDMQLTESTAVSFWM